MGTATIEDLAAHSPTQQAPTTVATRPHFRSMLENTREFWEKRIDEDIRRVLQEELGIDNVPYLIKAMQQEGSKLSEKVGRGVFERLVKDALDLGLITSDSADEILGGLDSLEREEINDMSAAATTASDNTKQGPSVIGPAHLKGVDWEEFWLKFTKKTRGNLKGRLGIDNGQALYTTCRKAKGFLEVMGAVGNRAQFTVREILYEFDPRNFPEPQRKREPSKPQKAQTKRRPKRPRQPKQSSSGMEDLGIILARLEPKLEGLFCLAGLNLQEQQEIYELVQPLLRRLGPARTKTILRMVVGLVEACLSED